MWCQRNECIYLVLILYLVLQDGKYVKPLHSKLSYGVMVQTRVGIVFSVSKELSRALTIATRYSAVRRQSEMVPGWVVTYTGYVTIPEFFSQVDSLFPVVIITMLYGNGCYMAHNVCLTSFDLPRLAYYCLLWTVTERCSIIGYVSAAVWNYTFRFKFNIGFHDWWAQTTMSDASINIKTSFPIFWEVREYQPQK